MSARTNWNPPTQSPAFINQNNNFINNKQQHMNNNNMNYQNGSSSIPLESQSIQILSSDPEQSHLLKYTATEQEWTDYLIGSGLQQPKKDNQSTKQIETLKPTSGGPSDFKQPQQQSSSKYAIISIMGPQSSGKSTILNKLFGTKFAVMDHKRGRHQVTTGIWMGSCPKAKELMVLDLEGTDSAERKQNRSNFERQTSLMALTLSEVLIINMWASDIGRSTGMNVDTLRAILEANLRLFSPNSKTLLLFLIREQSPDETQFGVTPSLQLRQTIESVLISIWNDIEKPQNFDSTQLSDLFEIDFFFMPPLVYFEKEFEAKVAELYSRFTNENDANYYFSTSYHFGKCVPTEGLFTWTQQIFNAITEDESLNIPDQQKLLSAYRCEHAANESFEYFKLHSKELTEQVKEGYVDGFGAKCDEIIGVAMSKYRETANKYDANEANEKYASLVDKIETQIQFLFAFQYAHLCDKLMEIYAYEMKQALPSGICVDNLSQIVARIGQNVRKFFSQKIDECMISTENKEFLDKDTYWKETQKRLREATKSIQLEEWQLLLKENDALAEEHLLSVISRSLRKPNEAMWTKISLLRVEYHQKMLNERILCKLNNLMYDDIVLLDKVSAIKSSTDNLIIARCKKYCSRMDSVLKDCFDAFFNKDPSNGIPRRWDDSVANKLDQIFVDAKKECFQILSLSQQIVLSKNDDLKLEEIKLNLLTSEVVDDIRSDFLRFADNEYRRAQDRIRTSSMIGGGLLPTHPVSWLIFLFFAKDEIWTMLTNPLYLILFVFGAAILIIGYQAHVYGFDVQTIVMQMVQKIINLIVAKLEEFQAAQIDIQQRGKRRSSRSGSRSLSNEEENNINPTPQ